MVLINNTSSPPPQCSSAPPFSVSFTPLTDPSAPLDVRLDTLRRLKNEIVGHEQRKEAAVRGGAVAALAAVLGAGGKGGVRAASNGVGIAAAGAAVRNGGVGGGQAAGWTVEEEVRLQGVLILGSLAIAGPAFVPPILAGQILQPLLHIVANSPHSSLISASLQVLLALGKSARLDQPEFAAVDADTRNRILDQVYARPAVEKYAEILARRSTASTALQQVRLVAQLVASMRPREPHRNTLLRQGLLDSLASRLGSTFFSDEYPVQGLSRSTAAASLPSLPPSHTTDLLIAISAIIRNSSHRTARFLYSPAIVSLPPALKTECGELPPPDGYPAPRPVRFDEMLPRVHVVPNKRDAALSTSFPALGSLGAAVSDNSGKLGGIAFGGDHNQQHATPRGTTGDDLEGPIFTWLIYLARRAQGLDRLAAIALLTQLKRFGDCFPWSEAAHSRERPLAFLIVPLLVRMISEASAAEQKVTSSVAATLSSSSAVANSSSGLSPYQRPGVAAENRRILEWAPFVLAQLIENSKALQRAADDADAIKKLSQILKRTFDPVTPSHKPMWSPVEGNPSATNGTQSDDTQPSPSSTMGDPGPGSEVLHALKCRAAILEALSAIAEREDSFRKGIVECGAFQCITDSLAPLSDKPITGVGPRDGNPPSVLIAACHATKSISRSVNMLRTSLIDYGVAKPIMQLMFHPDAEVQAAATEPTINFMLDFSPMRSELLEAGYLKLICQYAHSNNPALRLNALWALKHMMIRADDELKIRCMDELGSQWLARIISGDAKDLGAARAPQSATPIAMGTSNAAGEQVDLLNAVEEPPMDIDEEANGHLHRDDDGTSLESSDEESDVDAMADSADMQQQGSHSQQHHPAPLRSARMASTQEIRRRLRLVREVDQDGAVQARAEEARVLEQALDFVRNIICDTHPGVHEMIDHLLNQIGHSRLFELIASKLRPLGTASLPLALPPSPSSSSSAAPATGTGTGTDSSSSPSGKPAPLHSTSNSALLPPHPPHLLPPAEIVATTVYILVHIANGRPAHRELVLSHPLIPPSVLPHFRHPDPKIRNACVLLVTNLTHSDDGGEAGAQAARARALEVRQAGWEREVRALLGDQSLSVRERAKLAFAQLEKLLAGVPDPGPGGGAGEASGGQQGWGTRTEGPFGGLPGMEGHRAWER